MNGNEEKYFCKHFIGFCRHKMMLFTGQNCHLFRSLKIGKGKTNDEISMVWQTPFDNALIIMIIIRLLWMCNWFKCIVILANIFSLSIRFLSAFVLFLFCWCESRIFQNKTSNIDDENCPTASSLIWCCWCCPSSKCYSTVNIAIVLRSFVRSFVHCFLLFVSRCWPRFDESNIVRQTSFILCLLILHKYRILSVTMCVFVCMYGYSWFDVVSIVSIVCRVY